MTTIDHSLEFKRRMRAGEVLLGSWVDLVDQCACEIMAGIGFDWFLIDTEHGPIDISTLQSMLIGMRGSSTVPLVRVPWNDQVVIKRTLDVGAMGIIVPLVRTAQDVRDAISYAKYPPAGVRGCSPRRASDYFRDIDNYLAKANDGIIVVVQIEHIDAVNNLDEILAVPDLDGIFIGPADLSNSMGFFNQPQATEVTRVIEEVIRKGNEAGVCVGLAVGGTVEQLGSWPARGVQLLPVGGDRRFMMNTAMDVLSGVKKYLQEHAG
jgi:2-keto-3-deoxy-L-rhamnonate aldolase RhmA